MGFWRERRERKIKRKGKGFLEREKEREGGDTHLKKIWKRRKASGLSELRNDEMKKENENGGR